MATERIKGEIDRKTLRKFLSKPTSKNGDWLRGESPRGFGVRKYPPSKRNPKGKAVFVVEARLGSTNSQGAKKATGKVRRVTLSEASIDGLQKAKEAGAQELSKIRGGSDVTAKKRSAAITGRLEHLSLGDALELHINAKSKNERRPMAESTKEDMRRVFRLHLPKGLKERPVLELQPVELYGTLQSIQTDSNRAKARRYLSAVIKTALFHLNSTQQNPMELISGIGTPPKGRTTYLPAGCAKQVWQWFESEEAHDQPERLRSALLLIKFVMLTGARRDEAGDLEWDAVDSWGQNLIRLMETKNGTTHFIPITEPIQTILNDAEQLDGKSNHVFKGTGGEGGVTTSAISDALELVWSKTEAQLMDGEFNRITDRAFTLHDLRRTIATLLYGMGTPKERISRILNHRKVDRTGAATELYIQTEPAIFKPELDKYHEFLQQPATEFDAMVAEVWETADNEEEEDLAIGERKVIPFITKNK